MTALLDTPGMNVVAGAVMMAIVCLVAAAVFLHGIRQDRRVRRRVAGLRGKPPPASNARGETAPAVLGAVAAIGAAVARSGVLPAATVSEMQASLAASGLLRLSDLGLFVGSKLLLFFGLPLAAYGLAHELDWNSTFARILPFIGAAVGLVLPDALLRRIRQRYLDGVGAGVPDALDMLVICAQAGLGLEPAMHRVATEMRHSHPALSRELRHTTAELRISVDSRAALANLGARTGLESLKRVASTLAQTLRYGTPLTDALRALAAETRQMALTRYEERAARLPVLLTLPMIMFIFPCVFIVIGGPAVLALMKAFGR